MTYTQITIEEYMMNKELEDIIKNHIEKIKSEITFWTRSLNFNAKHDIDTSTAEKALQAAKNKLEKWQNRLLKGDY